MERQTELNRLSLRAWIFTQTVVILSGALASKAESFEMNTDQVTRDTRILETFSLSNSTSTHLLVGRHEKKVETVPMPQLTNRSRTATHAILRYSMETTDTLVIEMKPRDEVASRSARGPNRRTDRAGLTSLRGDPLCDISHLRLILRSTQEPKLPQQTLQNSGPYRLDWVWSMMGQVADTYGQPESYRDGNGRGIEMRHGPNPELTLTYSIELTPKELRVKGFTNGRGTRYECQPTAIHELQQKPLQFIQEHPYGQQQQPMQHSNRSAR